MHIMVISVEAAIGGNTKQWSKADGKKIQGKKL